MEPYENFQAYVDRKLFTHNCGHAIAAYLGYLRGHRYIYQAIADARNRRVVVAALDETGRALIAKHGFTPEEHRAHIQDLLERFGNAALRDQVSRVARDPLRKLGPEDRLVGAAKLALTYGVEPVNVCTGIAAALLYDSPDDPTAQIVQQKIREHGVKGVLQQICGIDPRSKLAGLVIEQLGKVREEFARNGR